LEMIFQLERHRQDSIRAISQAKADSIRKIDGDIIRALGKTALLRQKQNPDFIRQYSSTCKQFKGKVIDIESQTPLPGTNIIVMGTCKGIMSDHDGNFIIDAPENAILQFSFVGYFPVQIDITNLNYIGVYMEVNRIQLEDVIIQGYEPRRMTSVTYSVSSVASSTVKKTDTYRDNDNDFVQGTYSINLKNWEPDSPYLDSLKKSTREKLLYDSYLSLRNKYEEAPSFFLDVASYMISLGDTVHAIKVLSNLSEMCLQNHEVLRVLGRKLLEYGETEAAIAIFKKVVELRPFEPQSYRDLGLAYKENHDCQDAIETLYNIITKNWNEQFAGLETIVLGEINDIIVKAGKHVKTDFIDKRFLVNLPTDVRIVIDWDDNNTDLDLLVTDPNGEKCYYNNPKTMIGGYISDDMREGYGPEEFLLRKAIEGEYKVDVDYYADTKQSIVGPATIQVYFFTNFGRKNEQKKQMTVRLTEKEKVIHIGELKFQKKR